MSLYRLIPQIRLIAAGTLYPGLEFLVDVRQALTEVTTFDSDDGPADMTDDERELAADLTSSQTLDLINELMGSHRDLVVCEHSGDIFYSDDTTEVEGVGPVGDVHLSGNFGICYRTDNWYRMSELVHYMDGSFICRDIVENHSDDYEWSTGTESFWDYGESPDHEDESESEASFDPDYEPEPAYRTAARLSTFVDALLTPPIPTLPEPPPLTHPLRASTIWENTARGRIKSYSANVLNVIPRRNQFRYTAQDRLPLAPLWLGVELEVEPRGATDYSDPTMATNYIADTYAAVSEFAIMKTDSSLHERGFEIVSVPATLNAHYEMWRPFFKGPAKSLESWKSERCGMHVHVNRAAVSDLVLGRMLVFINKPDNTQFISRIAGRGETSYASRSPKKLTDGKVGRMPTHNHSAVDYSSRNDGKTFEVRIFRGNVSAGGFFKNLEFVHAAVHFCREATNADLSGDAFLSWLDLPGNRRVYKHLSRWASEHGMIKAPKRPAPEERNFEHV